MLWIEDKRGWKVHLSRAKAETLQLYGIIQTPCVCDTDSHCKLAMTHRIKSLMTLWAGYLTFLPSYDNKDKLSIKVIQKPRTYGESSGGLVRRRRDWEVIRRSYKRVIRLESLWLAHRVCTLQPLVPKWKNPLNINDWEAEMGTVYVLEAGACYLLRGLPRWIVTCNVENKKML